MPDHINGRRFRVPASRNLSRDLLSFHRHVPLCPHDRRMMLGELSAVRGQCGQRVSWPALFLKAFGLLAREVPEFRRTWYRWPWDHMFQHPSSTGTLTVQRSYDGEPWLFWGIIPSPETLSLVEIQRRIDRFRDEPVESVFRKQLQFARLPTFLRRMIWWWNLNIATTARAKRVGTFFLSTLAGRGAEIQLPPSVQTGCLTFGPLDRDGVCRVTLAYDHRVMDGALVADALQRLEQILVTDLAAELRAAGAPASSRQAA